MRHTKLHLEEERLIQGSPLEKMPDLAIVSPQPTCQVTWTPVPPGGGHPETLLCPARASFPTLPSVPRALAAA